MPLNVEETIRDHWGVRHMSLSTIKETGPPARTRTTALDFVAHPSGLTLCFRTLLRREVAQDLSMNSYVSGNIVREHAIGQSAVTGVSFEGTAVLLGPSDERAEFAELYAAKLGGTAAGLLTRADQSGEPQFFAVDVTDWYVYAPPQEGEKPLTHHFQFAAG